jgi:hypothetical protein
MSLGGPPSANARSWPLKKRGLHTWVQRDFQTWFKEGIHTYLREPVSNMGPKEGFKQGFKKGFAPQTCMQVVGSRQAFVLIQDHEQFQRTKDISGIEVDDTRNVRDHGLRTVHMTGFPFLDPVPRLNLCQEYQKHHRGVRATPSLNRHNGLFKYGFSLKEMFSEISADV